MGEVAQAVSAACDKASKCKDALASAQDLAEVVKGITELWRTLGAGVERAQSVLDAIRSGTSAPPSAAVPVTPAPPAPAGWSTSTPPREPVATSSFP
ncbi:hypothetical protein GCM10022243_34280 [Saccharothrix violaceirubra]